MDTALTGWLHISVLISLKESDTENKPTMTIYMIMKVSGMTIRYSANQLLKLGQQPTRLKVDSRTWNKINELEIVRQQRGVKGGRRKQRKILPWTTNRVNQLEMDMTLTPGINNNNLTLVTCKANQEKLLKVSLINARSICNKAAVIKDYIIEENLDILTITETWLGNTNNLAVGEIAPPGFSVIHKPRLTGKGGGVGIVHRDSIECLLEDYEPGDSFEAMTVKITCQSYSYRLTVIYRPPPSQRNRKTANMFLDDFDEFLSRLIQNKSKLVLVGDLNVHFDVENDPVAKKVSKMLDTYGLQQLVTSSTHRCNQILNVVICKENDCPVVSFKVIDPLISDHSAVEFLMETQRPSLPHTTLNYRQIKKINIEDFRTDIVNCRLLLPENLGDEIDEVVENYDSALSDILDKHAAIKSKVISIKPTVPWYNDSVAEARRNKRRCERKWRATRLCVHRQIYQDARDKLHAVIDEAKKDYFQDKITSSTSQGALYDSLNQLLFKKKSTCLPDSEDSKQLADDMADFFSGKVQRIRDTLEKGRQEVASRPHTANPCSISTFSSFPLVTEEDVKKIVVSLPPKSCSSDPIPTLLLKECIDQLIPSITKIINLSLTSSKVPSKYKKAVISPLIKKAGLDKNEHKNYRPVSNLSFLSKLLERIVSTHLKKHRLDNNLEEPYQSSYRQHHSTETAVVCVQDDVLMSLDSGECVFLVLLDLSCAFDTPDHEIMQNRLSSNIGIADGALKWIVSYLTERKQTVIINGVKSSERDLKYGVPQGSVLGPELFKDYMNPLGNLIRSYGIKFHFYADDSQLYVSFKPGINEHEALNKLELCISHLKTWMAENYLKLNDDKTEFVIIGSQHMLKKVETATIRVGDHDIKPVSKARNIGTIFDCNMSMEAQVNKMVKSAWNKLYSLGKIRGYLTEEQTQQAIHAFVTSQIDLNNAILCDLPSSLTKKLQRVQHASARLIKRVSKRDHITCILQELHWLPIPQRCIYKVMLMVFKCLNGIGPEYLKNKLVEYRPSRNLRSAASDLLVVPKTRCSTMGDRAFSVFAPRMWNRLPLSIRQSKTVSHFKSQLKTHLFKMSY